MKLLFTGASGFLGHNVKPLLDEKYEVKTMGLTGGGDIKVDLSKTIPVFNEVFDVVLHAAGKAHTIAKTEDEKKAFFDMNYYGTVNLCKALEKSLPKAFIFVSTVAVYGLEFGNKITENYPLQGKIPYAISKIQAENYLTEWCAKNGVTLGIIRPSLIAGLNAKGNLGAMIDGISVGRYFSVGDGKARKSILMAQDIAMLVPMLIEKGGVYNVCDDTHPSFRELEVLIAQQLNKKRPLSLPYFIAKMMALVGDLLRGKAPIDSHKLLKITKSLTFSNEKAKKELNWKPTNVLENFKIK